MFQEYGTMYFLNDKKHYRLFVNYFMACLYIVFSSIFNL